MSDPLFRGCVVARGRRSSVVWTSTSAELVLLPILRPRVAMACDVPLGLADMVACSVSLIDAVIRPRPNAPAPRKGWVLVGSVPGATMCRVVHGLARVHAEASCAAKWGDDDRHRANARDRCVNLFGSDR